MRAQDQNPKQPAESTLFSSFVAPGPSESIRIHPTRPFMRSFLLVVSPARHLGVFLRLIIYPAPSPTVEPQLLPCLVPTRSHAIRLLPSDPPCYLVLFPLFWSCSSVGVFDTVTRTHNLEGPNRKSGGLTSTIWGESRTLPRRASFARTRQLTS